MQGGGVCKDNGPVLEDIMFTALETHGNSLPIGVDSLASFTMQAVGLSLLLVIPLIWVQRPPQVQWLQPLASPAVFTPAAATPAASGHHADAAPAAPSSNEITFPLSIADHIATGRDADSARCTGLTGHRHWVGSRTRRWHHRRFRRYAGCPAAAGCCRQADAGLALGGRQPDLPRATKLSRAGARRHGFRAPSSCGRLSVRRGRSRISVVVRGHPMLSAAAIEAVRQWRYHPYLLNNEPIEVETEITVNFVLSGS